MNNNKIRGSKPRRLFQLGAAAVRQVIDPGVLRVGEQGLQTA